MGWATGYIAKLRAGETVSFRPRGDSMSPRIESGDLCTVEPVDPATLRAGARHREGGRMLDGEKKSPPEPDASSR